MSTPEFRLLDDWDAPPTMAGIRGAQLAVWVLFLLTLPAIGSSNHFRSVEARRQNSKPIPVIHLVFYGEGKGGDPLSHCKGIFRVWNSKIGKYWSDEIWLYDEECESHQADVWLDTSGEMIYGFAHYGNTLETVMISCRREFDCEAEFIPQGKA